MHIDTFFEDEAEKDYDFTLPSPNTVSQNAHEEWSWTVTKFQSMAVSKPMLLLKRK